MVVCNATDNKVVAKFDEANWQGVSESYDDASGHGRKIRFTFAKGEELGEGNYNVYAFGYHTASDVTSQYKVGEQDLGTYLNSLTKGTSTLTKDLKITNSETGDTYNAEELFAGSTTISVSGDDNDFSVGMTLHRQVAGIYAYVMNIPYFKDAQYLDLYAVKRNNDLVLGHFYDAVLGANGTSANNQVNVVNGTNETAERTLVSRITLTDWFTKIQDVNNDGIIDRYGYIKSSDGKTLVENTSDQIWKNPYTSNNVTFVKGSAFSGEFIIPFQKGSTQTFVLELRDDDSELRTWNINLPLSDVEAINGKELITWNSSTANWTTGVNATDESQSAYSVLRNHLYSVGTKSEEDPSEGTDPEEPTPGTEDPEDLSTKQDLLLQVNDNWELIHKMEID